MARNKRPTGSREGGNSDTLFLLLMMQLLAFFILLASIATVEQERRRKAIESVTEAFGVMTEGASKTHSDKRIALPLHELVEKGVTPIRTAKELTEVAKLLGMDDAVNVLPLDKDNVLVRLPGDIVFTNGSSRLDSKALVLIDTLAKILVRPEISEITIQGHSDASPVKGRGHFSNWELSAERAMTVFRALHEREVPRGKMVVAGFGDQHPLPASENGGDATKNRRVDIRLRFSPATDKPERKEKQA